MRYVRNELWFNVLCEKRFVLVCVKCVKCEARCAFICEVGNELCVNGCQVRNELCVSV